MSKPSSTSASEPWWVGFLLIAGVALTAFIISLTAFFETLDHRIYDFFFQWRGEKRISASPLAIAAIDQRTADSLSFPFDRRHYGELIDHLTRLGASWIVFDVDFSSAGANPASDSAFQAAIVRSGRVVLAGKVDFFYHHGLRAPIMEIVRPVPEAAPPQTPFGLVNDFTDPDGVSRRYPLFITVRDTAFLSLGMKTLALMQNIPDVPRIDEYGYCSFGNLRLPMMDSSTTLLNYYGPAGSFPIYSFIDIISGAYDTDDLLQSLTPEERALLDQMGTADQMAEALAENPFKDKVVLVGATAEDLHDDKATPFFTLVRPLRTPGVEVHANAIQMMLDASFLRPLRLGWTLLGVLTISFLIYLTGRFWTHWRGLMAAAGLILLALAVGFGLFSWQGLWLHEMPLLLTAAVGYPVNLLFSIIKAQREKAFIRSMFGHYVPPKVIEQLIENPELLNLGGEKRRMTALFMDVMGFTTISERLSPEELVALLNEYLTPMSRIIVDHDGIIDKYEGDLIMAEFGAPIWFENHAARACRAALKMQEKLVEMRLKWKAENRAELFSRIGLNTGYMSVGNMGSEDMLDYTVMGDAVNFASRLEGANKFYGTFIMIGRETYNDVQSDFITRPLDLLRVKGKTEPVETFELMAEKIGHLSASQQRMREFYLTGIEQYRARRFEEARLQFEQALAEFPPDKPSHIYLKRCEDYIQQPPPEDWDGGWTLEEK